MEKVKNKIKENKSIIIIMIFFTIVILGIILNAPLQQNDEFKMLNYNYSAFVFYEICIYLFLYYNIYKLFEKLNINSKHSFIYLCMLTLFLKDEVISIYESNFSILIVSFSILTMRYFIKNESKNYIFLIIQGILTVIIFLINHTIGICEEKSYTIIWSLANIIPTSILWARKEIDTEQKKLFIYSSLMILITYPNFCELYSRIALIYSIISIAYLIDKEITNETAENIMYDILLLWMVIITIINVFNWKLI